MKDRAIGKKMGKPGKKKILWSMEAAVKKGL